MDKILSIASREWQYIRGNKRLLFVMCFIPTLYIVLFGIMYSNHVVKHIKTVVLDYNNTATSRIVVQAFRDSEKFDLVGQVSSEEELRQMLETREVTAAVVLPEDLDTNLKKGQGSEVLVIVNGTNMLFSNAVMSAANEIISTLSAGVSIKTLESSQALLPEKAAATALPLRYRLRVWYNPTFNYANFLLLGLACTALQQVILLYMAVAVAREKETGAIKDLLAGGYRAHHVVLGKMIPYFLLNIVSANVVLALCFTVFQIPFRGHYPLLLLLIAVFILAILTLGIFLSIVCRSELEATQLAMLVAIPSFLFSGFTWPVQSMPLFARAISASLPLTYLVSDVRDIALMGIGFSQVLPNLLVLVGIFAVLLPASIWCFNRQYQKFATPVQQQSNIPL
ncbi:MAG: ABC transporter permease [Bacillota bacterium]|uniref:ABC transporter permease n=1 Tax=Desulforamulus profundi TaxID=1383067 RepID=UPI000BFFF02A|nr:ABC transporter permease [Desulforamulus profundi]